MNREYTCTVAKQGLPESRPASLKRTAVLVMNKEHRYTLPEEGLLASRPASVQRTAVAIMHREHACKLAEEGSLESRPASLQRTAVPSIETPAETTQEPRISGACRTIRRRWSKILKAKDRMMTPRKLIKKSPAPYRPAPCSTCKYLLHSVSCMIVVAFFLSHSLCRILFVAFFLLHSFRCMHSFCCMAGQSIWKLSML